ncbi:hypothetical protein [Spiroplasma culicicola]|uniref:Uncharacterized protein n=1 Tax=Spiroplasma culicicola AES-1 TaxID=1276246 RepID=W6A5M5_9MOLU|nr:hypothetical protein [Spiroplasma culicicola]AHI52433.1 hypothetical protein SCULI_v1c00920 [Spiroplasma culicicola AES-1]
MRKAAYILNIISTIATAIVLIPLIWTIPMTIKSKKIIGDGQEHVAFGVCSLFFTNIISGILTLIPEN